MGPYVICEDCGEARTTLRPGVLVHRCVECKRVQDERDERDRERTVRCDGPRLPYLPEAYG